MKPIKYFIVRHAWQSSNGALVVRVQLENGTVTEESYFPETFAKTQRFVGVTYGLPLQSDTLIIP